ncbi:hypothetical protein ACIOD1_33080 [Streptomyces sp. NPDC088097]|uniref:hypothetical protein n=1 Tax=Streptomyces sp. NPDC088097 TaxID=3365823 RepID=UPI0038011B50
MARIETTPEDRLARLRARLDGAGKAGRGASRLTANRPRNILAGVALHAAARHEQGLELSDLEQRLVEVMRVFVGDEEIAACGAAYRQSSARAGATLFPAQITQVPVETPYSFADLRADLPALAQEILAQPNVNIVNVADLEPGTAVDGPDAVEAMAAYGGSAVTVLTGPPGDEGAAARAGTVAVNVHPLKFQCVRDTNDQMGGSDEIYWVSGAGSDMSAEQTYRSQVFGGLDTGDWANFDGNASLYRGSYQEVLLLNLECWEEDSGNIFDEIQKHLWKVAQSCADAAVSITENGQSNEAALAAVVAIVAALLTWLLGWLTNDDDLVGERSIAINRQALRHLVAHPAAGGEQGALSTLVWDFSSPEGHYRLHTQLLPAPDENVYTKQWYMGEWTDEVPVPQSRAVVQAPGVGALGDTFYLLHNEPFPPTAELAMRTFDGTTWGPTASTPIRSTTRPSNLAVLGGELRCLVSSDNGSGGIMVATLRNGQWTTSYSGTSGVDLAKCPPSITVLGNKLVWVYPTIRSYTDNLRSLLYRDGDGSLGPEIPDSKDARNNVFVATGDNKVYCIFTTDRQRWASYDGTTWTNLGIAPFDHEVIALTGFSGNMYAITRGDGSDIELWAWNPRVPWENYGRIPNYGGSRSGVCLAGFKDRLHLFYRR